MQDIWANTYVRLQSKYIRKIGIIKNLLFDACRPSRDCSPIVYYTIVGVAFA
jgi:hypothetical protein